MLEKMYNQITMYYFIKLKLCVGFHTRGKIDAMSDVNLVLGALSAGLVWHGSLWENVEI